MDETGNWCQIESDPGVFSKLIQGFGVNGLQVEEIWSFDDDSWKEKSPIYGLIFLFKWEKADEPMGSLISSLDLQTRSIFFAKQVIQNACGSLALVNLLLNISTDGSDVALGKTLTDLREFCQGFDPTMTGHTLTNCSHIREVHNSFARQTIFQFEDDPFGKKEDVYHFVTYLPVNGRLYELDGLRESPIDLGECGDVRWMDTAVPIVKQRMAKYASSEIHFSLMAVVPDQVMVCDKKISTLEAQLLKATEQTKTVLASDLAKLKSVREEELFRRTKADQENERRLHNYIPFILHLMKMLGTKGKLMPMYEKAKEKTTQREKRKQKCEPTASPSTDQAAKKIKTEKEEAK